MEKPAVKPLNVAMVFDDLMIGGWTTVACAIPLFDRKKINPVVICLFGKGYYAELLEKQGCEILFLGINKFNFPLKIIRLVFFLRGRGVDIVHTHLLLSHVIGQTAAILAGIRSRIMHVHSLQKVPGGVLGIWMRWVVGRVDMIIPVSRSAEGSFLRTFPYFKGRSALVCNGIDVCEFRRRFAASKLGKSDFGMEQDEFCVIMVANFKAEKGHRSLIEAAALLDDCKIRYLLVGDGAEKEDVEKMAKEKGLEKKIIFLGSREDVPELLAVADMLVLPSLEEGFGICLLEAFAVGVPVLASDVGGISEIAVNGKNSLLVQPSKPVELARGIRKLKEDKELRKTLSDNAKNGIMDFDISKVVKCYTEAYMKATHQS